MRDRLPLLRKQRFAASQSAGSRSARDELHNSQYWQKFDATGVVAERLKAAVLKTAKGESPS